MADPPPERFSFADVVVDFKGHAATRAGRAVELTAKEFALLRFLIQRQGEVVDRGVILEEVWGEDWDVFPRTVDSHIAHLRQKLELDPASPRHILNVRGVGYKFMADPP